MSLSRKVISRCFVSLSFNLSYNKHSERIKGLRKGGFRGQPHPLKKNDQSYALIRKLHTNRLQ